MPQDMAEGCLEQLTSSTVRVWVSLGLGLEVRIWVSALPRPQIYRAAGRVLQGKPGLSFGTGPGHHHSSRASSSTGQHSSPTAQQRGLGQQQGQQQHVSSMSPGSRAEGRRVQQSNKG